MLAEGEQVKLIFEHQCSHTSPAVGARNFYAVDTSQPDPRKRANGLGDFCGGNILTLPAKRVTDAIDKIEEAALVLSHQVARTKPSIASLEDAANDFFFCSLRVGIAFQPAAGLPRSP